MKIKRMLTSALAVICMFCMSIPAMAAVPAQDSDFIENQKASTIKAAEEAGKDAPEESPHYYKKLSHLFSFSQVEPVKRKAAKK